MPLLQLPEVASSGEWFSSSGWYGGAEVLFFDRSRIDRQTVGEERNAATGALVDTFTTTPIPFDLAPGARITIGDWLGRDDLDRDRSLELVYYGGFSFFQRDSRNALPGTFTDIINLMETGQIDTTPWITHRCALADIPEQFSVFVADPKLLKCMIEV